MTSFYIDWWQTDWDEWEDYPIDPTWHAETPEKVVQAVEEFLPYVDKAPTIEMSYDYEAFKKIFPD